MFERLARSQSKSQPKELVKPGREGDQKRAEALEEQVKILSSTASEAVDRASELEEEVRHLRQITRSASQQSALSSFSISTNGTNQLKSHGSMNSLFSTLTSDTSATFDEEEESLYRKSFGTTKIENPLLKERQLRIAAEEKLEELSKSLSLATSSRIKVEAKCKALEENISTKHQLDDSREKRLHTLEVAIMAICSARKELNSIRHYKYI